MPRNVRSTLCLARAALVCRPLTAVFIVLALSSGNVQSQEPFELDPSATPMRGLVERFREDYELFRRANRNPMSDARADRAARYLEGWRRRLNALNTDGFDTDQRIDFLLLDNKIRWEIYTIRFQQRRNAELAPLLPFAPDIAELLDAQQKHAAGPPRQAAERLSAMATKVRQAAGALKDIESPRRKILVQRAGKRLAELRRLLAEWFAFRKGYDPEFDWWNARPYQTLAEQLTKYENQLRKQLSDQGESQLVGDPIGHAALMQHLRYEWIAHPPDELIRLAESERQWCETELRRASGELGFGDAWQQAMDRVKDNFVAPGKQPELIRELAQEAITFLDKRSLVTIPDLCRQSWRMRMMSPQRQRTSPYFTGGEVISVSFPTNTMSHDEKLMSLRSNNVHFCRATVHHELIPGHHLQMFMADRYRPHRRLFRTPFLVEGWALYWEMLLWDLDFAPDPADRVGMLFWRLHRCARVILSLEFHSGKRDPTEMIDYLVERVGHERSAATAEVRRWIGDGYSPLYQAAYLIGGLQLRALRAEVDASGAMSAREFHDAVLRENSIPIELIRCKLTQRAASADAAWRFGDASL